MMPFSSMDLATERDMRYIFSALNCFLSIILTAFETASDIALMGAVFPMGIAISSKLLPTAGTDKRIDSPLLYTVRMFMPPFLTTFTAAEYFFLYSFSLPQLIPTFTAEALFWLFILIYCFTRHFTCQPIPPAEAPDRIP